MRLVQAWAVVRPLAEQGHLGIQCIWVVLASKSGRGYHVSLDEAARAREWLQSMLARVEEHPVEVRLKLGYVAGLIMAGQRNLDSADIQAWLQYASLANSATDAQWYASEETLGVLQAKTVACQRLSTSLEKMQILFSADRLTQSPRFIWHVHAHHETAMAGCGITPVLVFWT